MDHGTEMHVTFRRRPHPGVALSPVVTEQHKVDSIFPQQEQELHGFVDGASRFLDDTLFDNMYRKMMEGRPVSIKLTSIANELDSFRVVESKLRFIKVFSAVIFLLAILNTARITVFKSLPLLSSSAFVLLRILTNLFIAIESARVSFNCHFKTYITHAVDSLTGEHVRNYLEKGIPVMS